MVGDELPLLKAGILVTDFEITVFLFMVFSSFLEPFVDLLFFIDVLTRISAVFFPALSKTGKTNSLPSPFSKRKDTETVVLPMLSSMIKSYSMHLISKTSCFVFTS
jgi:hypothetical protein